MSVSVTQGGCSLAILPRCWRRNPGRTRTNVLDVRVLFSPSINRQHAGLMGRQEEREEGPSPFQVPL